MMYEEKAILVEDEQVYAYVERSVSYVKHIGLNSLCCLFQKACLFMSFWRGHNRLLFILWSVVSIKVLLV